MTTIKLTPTQGYMVARRFAARCNAANYTVLIQGGPEPKALLDIDGTINSVESFAWKGAFKVTENPYGDGFCVWFTEVEARTFVRDYNHYPSCYCYDGIGGGLLGALVDKRFNDLMALVELFELTVLNSDIYGSCPVIWVRQHPGDDKGKRIIDFDGKFHCEGWKPDFAPIAFEDHSGCRIAI